jgi:hypothetical protein
MKNSIITLIKITAFAILIAILPNYFGCCNGNSCSAKNCKMKPTAIQPEENCDLTTEGNKHCH